MGMTNEQSRKTPWVSSYHHNHSILLLLFPFLLFLLPKLAAALTEAKSKQILGRESVVAIMECPARVTLMDVPRDLAARKDTFVPQQDASLSLPGWGRCRVTPLADDGVRGYLMDAATHSSELFPLFLLASHSVFCSFLYFDLRVFLPPCFIFFFHSILCFLYCIFSTDLHASRLVLYRVSFSNILLPLIVFYQFSAYTILPTPVNS